MTYPDLFTNKAAVESIFFRMFQLPCVVIVFIEEKRGFKAHEFQISIKS